MFNFSSGTLAACRQGNELSKLLRGASTLSNLSLPCSGLCGG
jgi:hypothetical protein